MTMSHRGARQDREALDDLISTSFYKSLMRANLLSSSNAYIGGGRKVSDIAWFLALSALFYFPPRLSHKQLCCIESLGGEAEPSPPYGICPGKPSLSLPTRVSPVWSRLARQPIRTLRDASFAIPLPISQTLIPAVSAIPCALPVDSAPVHASGSASCHRSQPVGLGGPHTRRRDDSAGMHECIAKPYRVGWRHSGY